MTESAGGHMLSRREISEALERRDEKVNAWFYVKDNGVCDDRVTALRQKLDSQTHFPVKRYRDVEELGAMIYDDLVARIDSLFPETYSDPYHNELRRNEYILADNLAALSTVTKIRSGDLVEDNCRSTKRRHSFMTSSALHVAMSKYTAGRPPARSLDT